MNPVRFAFEDITGFILVLVNPFERNQVPDRAVHHPVDRLIRLEPFGDSRRPPVTVVKRGRSRTDNQRHHDENRHGNRHLDQRKTPLNY
ncbi:hypothetical protein SDC9_186297 [bioreactor metagenome]|uniref:Uncharacterized protein n=1 Tax=bioreactor metagenome TaxID=1076179 RepID=A0A645HK59_9ZZZZ